MLQPFSSFLDVSRSFAGRMRDESDTAPGRQSESGSSSAGEGASHALGEEGDAVLSAAALFLTERL